jgi:dynein heavy chain
LVEKAKKALEGLNIAHFRDLKALKSPPKDIEKTFTACLHLLCKYHPNVPVDKVGKLKTEKPWATALSLMANPQQFLDILLGFKAEVDADKIPARNFNAIRDVLADETFTPEIVLKSSPAASGLCDWIINITMYYDVVVSVEPKKLAVAEAQATLAAANAKKEEVDILVARLNKELAELMAEF